MTFKDNELKSEEEKQIEQIMMLVQRVKKGLVMAKRAGITEFEKKLK